MGKKTTLKFQQRFRIESHKVFTEKVNKIALSTNDNKNCKWCHLISIWRSPWNGVELFELMKYTKIPDHSYRVLIVGDFGSGKMNVLLI